MQPFARQSIPVLAWGAMVRSSHCAFRALGQHIRTGRHRNTRKIVSGRVYEMASAWLRFSWMSGLRFAIPSRMQDNNTLHHLQYEAYVECCIFMAVDDDIVAVRLRARSSLRKAWSGANSATAPSLHILQPNARYLHVEDPMHFCMFCLPCGPYIEHAACGHIPAGICMWTFFAGQGRGCVIESSFLGSSCGVLVPFKCSLSLVSVPGLCCPQNRPGEIECCRDSHRMR